MSNTDLQTQLDELKLILDTDLGEGVDLIAQQAVVLEILNDAQRSIDSKQNLYETNATTQIREAILHQNSSDRMKQYNYMVGITALGVAGL